MTLSLVIRDFDLKRLTLLTGAYSGKAAPAVFQKSGMRRASESSRRLILKTESSQRLILKTEGRAALPKKRTATRGL